MFAFVMFPLPALSPKVYWFTHSMWHVGCAVAYYELYCALEGDSPFYVPARPAKHINGRQRPARQRHKPSTKAAAKAQ